MSRPSCWCPLRGTAVSLPDAILEFSAGQSVLFWG